MGAGEFPPKGVPTGEIWREALRLYVAMTRGRDEVCLVHTGEPSPFLTAMTAAVSLRPLIFAQSTEEAQPAPSPIEAVKISEVDKPVIEPVIIPKADAPGSEVPVIPEPVGVAAEVEPATAEIPDEVAVLPESDAGHPAPVYTPTDQEEMVINGVTLIPIRGEPTVRSTAAAMGKNFVQIHNDFMNLGVYTRPDQSLVHAFVFKVMGKYGCAPIFRK
jgi:hypothetical protein